MKFEQLCCYTMYITRKENLYSIVMNPSYLGIRLPELKMLPPLGGTGEVT